MLKFVGMDNNILIPSVLFLVAISDLVLAPVIMKRVPPEKRLVIGGSMVMAAVMTAGIGVAFWMGWL